MNRKNKIVIIGGGYAGLQVALHINHPNAEITLIDKNNSHELLPELPHKITNPNHKTAIPFSDLLKSKDINFIQDAAEQINYAVKKITLSNGKEIEFDQIVLALGSITNYFGIPGLEEHSLSFNSTYDVEKVMEQIKENIAKTAKLEKDSPEYQELLSIVIGGGGLTGVEVAAELIEMLPTCYQQYGLDYADARIYLVEGMQTLLPMLPEKDKKLSERVTNFFQNRDDVELILGEFISAADSGSITLKSGRKIKSATTIWTGGIRASKFFDKPYINQSGEEESWPFERNNMVIVNEYFKVKGLENTFAIGACAWALNPKTGEPYQYNGQIAYQQGREVAKVINAGLEGEELSEIPALKSKGTLVSLGSVIGTGLVSGPLKVILPVNFIARWLKKLIELRYKAFDIR